MNPQARLSGNVLKDEKRPGTCYFSVGDNTALGGTSAVGIHIPGKYSKTLMLGSTIPNHCQCSSSCGKINGVSAEPHIGQYLQYGSNPIPQPRQYADRIVG